MKYYRTVFILGLWVAIVPFLGVPFLAKKILLIMPGLLLVLMGILMSQEYHARGGNPGASFQDSNPAEKVFTPLDREEKEVKTSDEEETEIKETEKASSPFNAYISRQTTEEDLPDSEVEQS
jgi:hypothetical protein